MEPAGELLAGCYHGEPELSPNDVDVAVVSESLTSFDLAEARLDLENLDIECHEHAALVGRGPAAERPLPPCEFATEL